MKNQYDRSIARRLTRAITAKGNQARVLVRRWQSGAPLTLAEWVLAEEVLCHGGFVASHKIPEELAPSPSNFGSHATNATGPLIVPGLC